MPGDTVTALRELPIEPLTPEAFAAFGTVIPPTDNGVPLGSGDARLDLGQGTPRFYVMRIPGRGFTVTRITDYAMRVDAHGPRVVKDWRRFLKRFERLEALGVDGTREMLGV